MQIEEKQKTGSIVDINQPIEYYIYELIYNKLCFKHRMKGSQYLIYYIEKAIKNNWPIHEYSVTKNIYSLIASHFNTTPNKVERVIRYAINIAWNNMDYDLKKYFYPTIGDNIPSNTEIIYTIIDYINRYYYQNQIQKDVVKKASKENAESTDNSLLNDYIYKLIYNKLKLKHKLNGSKYLTFFIGEILKNEEFINQGNVTKKIYPLIADEFKTTSLAVERSIGIAIEKAWRIMDNDVKLKIFSTTGDNRPTTMEIVYALADYIKINYPLHQNIEKNVVEEMDNKEEKQPIEQYICELIYNKLKIKHGYKGSKYLIFYITEVIKNNWEIYDSSVTKEIYPLIASHFNTTPNKVERDIRNVIENMWLIIDDDIKQKVFSTTGDNRPTNMESIHAIVDYIKINYPLQQDIEKNVRNEINNKEETTQSIEQYICELIYNKLEIKHCYKGSKYLIFYITEAIKNNWVIYDFSATKDIYPLIAKHFNTTSNKIERSIRYVIENMWLIIDDDIKQKIFLTTGDNRPTNMESIHAIVDYIRKKFISNKTNISQNIGDKTIENLSITEQQSYYYIIEFLTQKLKFKRTSLGTSYLLFYIEQVIKNNWVIYDFSAAKNIYPLIASHFNQTPENVQQSVRNIIQASWKIMDEDTKKQIFPIIKNIKPTTTEIIYAIIDYLKAHNPYQPVEYQTFMIDGKEKRLSKKKFKYYLRFELQKMLEESFGICSKFGIIKFQMLVDAIMISIQMNGVTDNEMVYILSKISEMYGKYESYENCENMNTIVTYLYKMCNQIYESNSVDFPEPKDKSYIKSYLNIMSEQIRSKYYN